MKVRWKTSCHHISALMSLGAWTDTGAILAWSPDTDGVACRERVHTVWKRLCMEGAGTTKHAVLSLLKQHAWGPQNTHSVIVSILCELSQKMHHAWARNLPRACPAPHAVINNLFLIFVLWLLTMELFYPCVEYLLLACVWASLSMGSAWMGKSTCLRRFWDFFLRYKMYYSPKGYKAQDSVLW